MRKAQLCPGNRTRVWRMVGREQGKIHLFKVGKVQVFFCFIRGVLL